MLDGSNPTARRIRRRVRSLLGFGLLLLGSVSWPYLGLSTPPRPVQSPPSTPTRGPILASDGTLLALSAGRQRRYPQGTLGGALLGFVGTERGLEGLEHRFEARLAAGEPLRLTLSPAVQAAAQSLLEAQVRRFGAQWGALVVLEVGTGRVLALAGAPAFDPLRWRGIPPERWRNRALLERFEPGSVIKALTVATALEQGTTRPGQVYDTPMSRVVAGVRIGDAVAHPARLSTAEILRYSSNVGMTHLVEALPARTLERAFRSFGLGERVASPGLEGPPGELGSAAGWGELGRATRAFGQGLSLNTLQLAASFNTLAEGGLYRAPRLLEDAPPMPPQRVLRAETARTVRQMLHGVVEGNIARRAALEGYHTGGKTGTAQTAVPGGYSETVYMSTFAGFFPVDTPRVTVALALRGAQGEYQGSQVAAPVFRNLVAELAALWGYPPQPER